MRPASARCLLSVVALFAAACSRTSSDAPELRLNEVMARNQDFPFTDVNGLHVDWIEIYNPSGQTVDLEGWSLTDDPDERLQYRFPASESLEPGGHLVVVLATDEDARAFEAAAPPGEQRVFRRTALHGSFGVDADDEDLFLYAREGSVLVDRVKVRRLASDLSAGRFPDGEGRFGPIFAPSPGGPNFPVGVKPVRWVSRPRTLPPLPDGRVPVRFAVEQDVDPELGLPAVLFEVARSPEGCDLGLEEDFVPMEVAAPLVAERVENPECEPGTPGATRPDGSVDPDDGCRRDARGVVVEARVRSLVYEVLLPAEECGTTVVYRVAVDDGVGVVEQRNTCFTYCAAPPSVVVTEYQPRNRTTILFACETCDEQGSCCGEPGCQEECVEVEGAGMKRVRDPDWIEIHNWGDEPVDLTRLGFRGRLEEDEVGEADFLAWLFGRDTTIDGVEDERMRTIGPGEFRLILADQDGGDLRRIYRRLRRDGEGNLVADMSRRYYSTPFALNPTRASGPDEFILGDAATRQVIDDAVLDFRSYAQENDLPFDDSLLTDQSVGRFPDEDPEIPPGATGAERYPSGVLRPGTVTPCPTPGGPNALVCDIEPSFELVATAFPRCPAAGEEVTVRTRLAVDEDSEPGFEVAVDWGAEGGDGGTLLRSRGEVVVEPAADQATAPPGTTVYDVEAVIPGQPEGALVSFAFSAVVRLVGTDGQERVFEPVLDETAARERGDAALSFVYRSGYRPAESRPRIAEVVPRNRTVALPGVPAGRFPDYVEILAPPEPPPGGGEAWDLSGNFLSQAPAPETEGVAIERPRLWAFPPGTTVAPGERLLLVFGSLAEPRSGVLRVEGFDLDGCGETVYLVGPDAGGNCVVDAFSWWEGLDVGSCTVDPETGRSAVDDVAAGRLCAGRDAPVRLSSPTPGAPNSLPPVLIGASHTSFLAEPGPCADPGTPIQVRVDFLLDRAVATASEDPVPEAFVELEDGTRYPATNVRAAPLPGSYPDFPGVPEGCRAPERDPPCHSALTFSVTLTVPEGGPVHRYRVEVLDACGRVLAPCDPGEACFSFGSSASPVPPLRVNEVDRFSAPPGEPEGSARAWIELHNLSGEPFDAGGLSLTNDPRVPRRAVLPSGTTVPAGGQLLVLTDGGPPLEGPDAPPHVVADLPWAQLLLDGVLRCRLEGSLFLFDRTENGSCLADEFAFAFPDVNPDPVTCGRPGQPGYVPNCTRCDDQAIGRRPDGGDAIEALDTPTPGAPNVTVPSDAPFVRGDATADGRVDIVDAVRILDWLFAGDGAHSCPDALDADDDGSVALPDALRVLSYQFGTGSPPEPPFPEPGPDPTPDDLPCRRESG